MQAGGDDGGVVAEKGVSGAQVVRQVPEMPVFKAVLRPVHDEQPGGIAAVGRLLRDEPVRQRVIEEIGLQLLGGANSRI